jgi:hypothetical protein
MIKTFKRITAASLVLCLAMIGCISQSTIGALTGTFGGAMAAVAAVEGNSALAQKITSDTAVAVAAIDNFKPGTPSQDTVQVINIVIADLNLLPLSGNEGALVAIALAAAEGVITAIEAESPGSTANFTKLTRAPATTPVAHNRDQFVALWNATINANPSLSKSLKIRPHWYSVKY